MTWIFTFGAKNLCTISAKYKNIELSDKILFRSVNKVAVTKVEDFESWYVQI